MPVMLGTIGLLSHLVATIAFGILGLALVLPLPGEMIPEEPFPGEEGPAIPWVPILAVAGAAILALIVIIVVVRRARHRKAAQADADLLASMDAEPLISED